MLISMLLTPALIANANWVVMKVSSSEWLMQSVQLTTIAEIHPSATTRT